MRKYFLTWNLLYFWTPKGIIKAWSLNQFQKDFDKVHANCEMQNLSLAARDNRVVGTIQRFKASMQ